MTLSQMIDLAEVYFYELDREVVPAQMLILLNQAQEKLVSMLNRNIITDLDVTLLAQSLGSSGEFDLSGLTDTIWHGTQGIDGIKHTDGKFCSKISYGEYKIQSDHDNEFTDSFPIYYVRGTNIYVMPYSDHTIDFYYREELTKMALGVAPASDTSCALNAMFHELIVGLALEDFVDLDPAIMRFYNRTVKNIELLNEEYPMSDSLRSGMLRNHSEQSGRFNFMNI